MTITVPNPDVLRAGVKHVEDHLRLWNQNWWMKVGDHLPDETESCGTTACLAGHILLSQGHTWAEIEKMVIPDRALDALGLERGNSDRFYFEDAVFGYVREDDWFENPILAGNLDSLDALKKRITEVTGVRL